MRRIRSPPAATLFPGVSLMLLLLLLVFAGYPTDALKLTNMSAPAIADLRKPMNLDCRFDMEGEDLYSVKWYKDEQEFFRYMPDQEPQTFPVAGVHLSADEEENTDCGRDHCSVTLSRLTREHSGGAYKCEISTEGPAFRLRSKTTNVTVAAPPEESPRIEGLSGSYAEGDTVSAKCTSAPADPAPILSWYINGQQAPAKYLVESESSEPDHLGLVSRSLTLRFPVDAKMSRDDTVRLSCVSSLPGVPLPPQETGVSFAFRPLRPQIINNQGLRWYGISSCGRTSLSGAALLQLLLLSAVRWVAGEER